MYLNSSGIIETVFDKMEAGFRIKGSKYLGIGLKTTKTGSKNKSVG